MPESEASVGILPYKGKTFQYSSWLLFFVLSNRDLFSLLLLPDLSRPVTARFVVLSSPSFLLLLTPLWFTADAKVEGTQSC